MMYKKNIDEWKEISINGRVIKEHSLWNVYRSQVLALAFNFYGLNDLTWQQFRDWFDLCTEFAEQHGAPFLEGACTPANKKYITAKGCSKAIDRSLKDNINIHAIEMRSEDDIMSIYSSKLIQGYIESYSVYEYNKFSGSSSFAFYKDLMSNDEFIELCIKVCKIIKPKYGFVYELPIMYNSFGYFIGIISYCYYHNPFLDEQQDIRERIEKWKYCGDIYRNDLACTMDGRLREIYPVNFVNMGHLCRYTHLGMQLQEWIKADSTRGAIEQITEELYMWKIEDQYLQQVTEELAKSNIVLCVNKENPKRYDYGMKPYQNIDFDGTLDDGRKIMDIVNYQREEERKAMISFNEEQRLHEIQYKAENKRIREENKKKRRRC